MPLAPGTRLGPYEVLAPLGEGGMGEVYRAQDTKLGRAVAIKILPESFAHDPDRLARFEREAKTLAALNHPNIATIHGVQDDALVMELVEGPTLAERIAQGPIPLDEALEIAKQIAGALEAAHDQGIIHRDLKPANIKLRPDGTVKVLDFGLAKVLDAETASGSGSRVSLSPTITSPALMTGAGVILGTAAYMSPEQAKGRPADKRSDIWAFGSVLYEMLTGKRPFVADDVSETLAFVLTKDPEWSALPSAVPVSIRTLLRRCLTKDRKRRLDSAADARLEIEDALTQPPSSALPDARVSAVRGTLWRYALGGAAVLVLAIAAGYAGWRLNPAAPRVPARFAIVLGEREAFTPGRQWIALSPDGRYLAYAADARIYLRALGDLDAKPIVTGDNSAVQSAPRIPFFSPDSQWLGFWQAGELKKVSVSGGAPVTLCAVEASPNGASWSADHTILVASPNTGIWRVSANGGTLEQIITVEGEQRVHGPQLLPDGRTVLFTFARNPGSWDEAEVVVQPIGGGTRQTLVTGGDGRYVPTGHIVYALGNTVLAMPFDASSLRATGVPVPVLEGVRRQTMGSASSQFALAADGTLAYVPTLGTTGTARTLVWVDRNGREEPIPAPAGRYVSLRLSPDGTRVALDTIRDRNRDIWMWDLERGTMPRLTSDPTVDAQPVWTSDGKRIIFSTDRTATGTSLFWQIADPSATAERLLEGRGAIAYTMHGRSLVVRGLNEKGGSDLMILDVDDTQAVRSTSRAVLKPLVTTPFEESNAAISPDGRWLAYQSNGSGSFEVYVQPFPAGDQVMVSTAGGGEPVWGSDSRELFYRDRNGAVMRVAIPVTKGGPTQVFAGSQYAFAGTAYFLNTYDIARDGNRFLMLKDSDEAGERRVAERIVIVQDWLEELKAKVRSN